MPRSLEKTTTLKLKIFPDSESDVFFCQNSARRPSYLHETVRAVFLVGPPPGDADHLLEAGLALVGLVVQPVHSQGVGVVADLAADVADEVPVALVQMLGHVLALHHTYALLTLDIVALAVSSGEKEKKIETLSLKITSFP